MNTIVSIPFELRLAILFLIGAFLGSLANGATYRLAWHRRSIGPWTKAPRNAPPRAIFDRIPIFGWLGLRRESTVHGPTFWIRPMLVELLAGFGLAWLYWWEVDQLALLPPGSFHNLKAIGLAIYNYTHTSLPSNIEVPATWVMVLHVQFIVHVILFWLMLVATLIDTDEKTIPDTITLPGTLMALIFAAVIPYSLLPDGSMPDAGSCSFLTLASPNEMPSCLLAGAPAALAIGLGCWWLWCVGLMRRDWYDRHGLRRAITLCFARLKRSRSTYYLLLLGLLGTIGIVSVWSMGDASSMPEKNEAWIGLISALVGMASAGGLVWIIRLIGAAVLRREAMGFGDVTLMAMLGAFLGWQASILTFFFAPLIAVGIGLAMWFLRRENEIPFGPFLCIAAGIVLLAWSKIWTWSSPRFELGILIPILIAACLTLMPILLGVFQIVKRLWRKPSEK